VKEERLQILNNMLSRIHAQKMRKRVGTTVEALLEEEEGPYFLARTKSNLRIYVRKGEGVQPGERVKVKLQSLQGTRIIGEVTGNDI
jgi:tRNA A37 methylthiotransferase MiaB